MGTATRYRRASPLARKIRPHVPYETPDVPGVCQTCRLPILTMADGTYPNQLHVTLDELLSQIQVSAHDVMALAAGDQHTRDAA